MESNTNDKVPQLDLPLKITQFRPPKSSSSTPQASASPSPMPERSEAGSTASSGNVDEHIMRLVQDNEVLRECVTNLTTQMQEKEKSELQTQESISELQEQLTNLLKQNLEQVESQRMLKSEIESLHERDSYYKQQLSMLDEETQTNVRLLSIAFQQGRLGELAEIFDSLVLQEAVEYVNGFSKENIEERHFCGRLTAVFFPIVKSISDRTGVSELLEKVLEVTVDSLTKFEDSKMNISILEPEQEEEIQVVYNDKITPPVITAKQKQQHQHKNKLSVMPFSPTKKRPHRNLTGDDDDDYPVASLFQFEAKSSVERQKTVPVQRRPYQRKSRGRHSINSSPGLD